MYNYILYLQLAEFFMFAGLMFLTVIIFAIMATFYTYVDEGDDFDEDKEKLSLDNTAFEMDDDIEQAKKKKEKLAQEQPPPYSENESTAL